MARTSKHESNFRELVASWSRGNQVSDSETAALCAWLSRELVSVSDANKVPSKPGRGLAACGIWFINNTMRWRVLDIATGEVITDDASDMGSQNVAEFMALLCALQHVDAEDLTVPIYSSSFVARKWVKNREFRSGKETPDVLLERIVRFNSVKSYPRDLVGEWMEAWGANPAGFFEKPLLFTWDAR